MIWTDAACTLYGAQYSPLLAEKLTKLSFSEKHEAGDVGVRGRFAGRAIPYGYSLLLPPSQATKEDPDYGTGWLADTVTEQRRHFQSAGATDIEIKLNVYHDGQCNLEFSSKLLRKLAESYAELVISCYEDAAYVEKQLKC